MAIGFDLMVPDTNRIFYHALLGEDMPCCAVCMRNSEKLYCPKLFCKWRDKMYSDFRKKYGKE